MSSSRPNADRFRESKLAEIGRHVPHDHWVWGTGTAQRDGTMIIAAEGRSSLGSGFIQRYNDRWRLVDVIGQMHVACPHLVQVWDVPSGAPPKARRGRTANRQADKLSRAAAEVGRFLLDKGIQRVMLAGVHARHGRAWLTVYRTHLGASRHPFNQEEADYFRYQVPSVLHTWLQLMKGQRDDDRASAPQTPFAALMPYELATVVHCALGDPSHAGPLLKKQFPYMNRKLSLEPGEGVERGTKRIQSHILNTRKAAMKAMQCGDIRTVRSLMLSGRC